MAEDEKKTVIEQKTVKETKIVKPIRGEIKPVRPKTVETTVETKTAKPKTFETTVETKTVKPKTVKTTTVKTTTNKPVKTTTKKPVKTVTKKPVKAIPVEKKKRVSLSILERMVLSEKNKGNKLEVEVRKIKNSIEDLSKDMKKGFTLNQKQFKEINDFSRKVDGVMETKKFHHLLRLGDKFKEFKQEMAIDITNIDLQAKQNYENFNSIKDDFTGIKDEISLFRQAFQSFKETSDNFRLGLEKLMDLETSLNSHSSKVDGIEEKIVSLEKSVLDDLLVLKQDFQNLKQSPITVKPETGSNGEALKSKFNQIDGRIDLLSDDVKDLTGKSEKLVSQDHSIEDVAHKITELYFKEVARAWFKRRLDLDSTVYAYKYVLTKLKEGQNVKPEDIENQLRQRQNEMIVRTA
ncbi:MAG: hypothetical protein ABH821_03390 [archaeon]